MRPLVDGTGRGTATLGAARRSMASSPVCRRPLTTAATARLNPTGSRRIPPGEWIADRLRLTKTPAAWFGRPPARDDALRQMIVAVIGTVLSLAALARFIRAYDLRRHRRRSRAADHSAWRFGVYLTVCTRICPSSVKTNVSVVVHVVLRRVGCRLRVQDVALEDRRGTRAVAAPSISQTAFPSTGKPARAGSVDWRCPLAMSFPADMHSRRALRRGDPVSMAHDVSLLSTRRRWLGRRPTRCS